MADISDILQGLSSRSANHDPFAEDHDPFAEERGQQTGQADLQALTRAWVNERGAAELLQYSNPSTVLAKSRQEANNPDQQVLMYSSSTVGLKMA